ncbi:MAG: beta-ketoacyl synthase chain length factor [Desulfovibrio sp.]|nr:beta-ketoacyl synthase chain length factor [Desulfovibrio sp.]
MQAEAKLLGLGVIHGLGDAGDLYKAIKQGQEVPREVLAHANPSELKTLLEAKALRRLPHYVCLALLAILRSIENANLHLPDLAEHCGLVLSSSSPCVSTGYDFMDSILDHGPIHASPTAFAHSVNNVATGYASVLLGLKGPSYTINQFEQSFTSALWTALLLLQAKRAPFVLVGGVEALDPRFLKTFPEMNTGEIPPSEGAVCFLLGHEGEGPTLELSTLAKSEKVEFASHFKQNAKIYGLSTMPLAYELAYARQSLKTLAKLQSIRLEQNFNDQRVIIELSKT